MKETWKESEKVYESFLPCAVHFCPNFLFLRFLLHLLSTGADTEREVHEHPRKGEEEERV